MIAGWLGAVVGVVVVAAVGFYLLLGVLIFVTHLIETRPVRYLAPAPDDDPERAKLPAPALQAAAPSDDPGAFNPYQAPASLDYPTTRNREAEQLGFTFHGLFASAKGGTYKARTALWVSPTRRTLALVKWGTIASLKVDKTILYSILEDGRVFITLDKPSGSEPTRYSEEWVVPGADLERLVRRHGERLHASGQGARLLTADHALADYEAILERRARSLVGNRDAYFVDPAETAIRSTLKGAFKAWARSFRPPRNFDRAGAPGGLPALPKTRPPDPAPLRWAGWLCNLAVFGALILYVRAPAVTPIQALFRLALLGAGLIGLALVAIVKAVLRRRNP